MPQMKRKASAARKLFGERLREERRAMGLTLEDLADTADMAWSYIAAVERGERNISVDNMAALAEAVEIELPLLLSRIPVRVNAGQPATR
jgi:transcriptional regulator with XRE-family HTH domain